MVDTAYETLMRDPVYGGDSLSNTNVIQVAPREKIGVVGATGCGKSTLALSFFRFVEAYKGRIIIDNIDISKIGLTDLRTRVTIIPQDPTILSGSLRSTLDPLEEYEDTDIFDALKRARLLPAEPAPVEDGEEVNYNPFYDLETEVSEQGQVSITPAQVRVRRLC